MMILLAETSRMKVLVEKLLRKGLTEKSQVKALPIKKSQKPILVLLIAVECLLNNLVELVILVRQLAMVGRVWMGLPFPGTAPTGRSR